MEAPSSMQKPHTVAPGPGLKLLIPVDASAASAWGLRYAIGRARAGAAVEVCLLHIAEPVRSWEVLRFYNETEVRRSFQERSAVILDQAAAVLRDAGIPCQRYFREGEAAAGIVALAEELDCSAIVVPHTCWLGIFPSGLAWRLKHRHGALPLVLVRADGSLEAWTAP